MADSNKNILVIGMGTPAFGKERRAVNTFKYMHQLKPYFLLSKWEDGSVTRLVERNHFEFTHTSFGYLGRARPVWTLVNLSQLPWLYACVLKSYFKQRCKTILILNVLSFINALPVLLWLKYLCGARLVFSLGDIPKNNGVNQLLGRLIAVVADSIIANSQAVKRGLKLLHIPDQQIKVIYNGVDIAGFEQAVSLDLRARFGWSPSDILIAYVGQFSVQKGIFDLAQAAELVLQKNSACKFIFVGKQDSTNLSYGELSDYVQTHHLQEQVVFLGWVEQIAGVMKAVDMLVVPSRYDDPAPNVNLEAMVCEIPVIATRAGGNPELIEDGETGFLVDKNSPKQIAGRVLELANAPELRHMMGKAGKARVIRLFNAQSNAHCVQAYLMNGSSSNISN